MKDFYDKFKLFAYADGACHGNGSANARGGWAFIIQFDNKTKEIHAAGYVKNTTNQRMEMLAVIKILEEIKVRWANLSLPIIIFSDSKYVVKGATDWMFKWERKGWTRQYRRINDKGNNRPDAVKVANLDLWKKMFGLVNEIKPVIQWVKGHSGNKYNELCNDLASTAINVQSDCFKIIRNPANGNI